MKRTSRLRAELSFSPKDGSYMSHRNICYLVRFEVFTAVTMKNGVFWDVTPCGSCKNRVSDEHSASFIRVTRIGELGTTQAATSNRRSVRRLLVRASVVPSSPILVTLMKEALGSSETRFLQEPHGVTSQKAPFFKLHCFISKNPEYCSLKFLS
jgi:hypothetical protein